MAMHKRMTKELPQLRGKTLQQDGLAIEEPDDAAADKPGTSFTALLAGPPDSPFAGGVFRLPIVVPPAYPMEPPKIHFETKIFHPNVGSGYTPGAICLDILRKEAWSPALTIERVLISIASLLADPNPRSPMNGEAAKLFTSDRPAYDRRVRSCVASFATPGGASAGSGWEGDFGKADEGDPETSAAPPQQPPAKPAAAKRNAIVIDESDDEDAAAKRLKSN